MIRDNKGLAFIIVLSFILVLAVIAVPGYMLMVNSEIRMTKLQRDSTRAFYLAEAGIEIARVNLRSDPGYLGTNGAAGLDGYGEYTVTVTSLGASYQVDSTGFVPDKSNARAQRHVRAIVAGADSPVSVSAAIAAAGSVTVTGNAEIESDGTPGIVAPDLTQVVISGSAEVDADPQTQQGEFPDFSEVFGLTEEQFKAASTVYTNPGNNEPDPADGLTWIEGNAKFTKSGWSGQGIIVITGNLDMTGGEFGGVIYVYGDLDMAGRADIDGAILAAGTARITGSSEIGYDSLIIDGLGDYYPPEQVTSWQEIR